MEKQDYVIRPAVLSDSDALIEMRGRYVHNLYQHMFGNDSLEEWREFDAPEIGEWLSTNRYWINVLETDGKIVGYIVYGLSGEPTSASIVETRIEFPCDADRRKKLVETALNQLKEHGVTLVHTWLQHDNFRDRFFFESLGFHRDGTGKVDSRLSSDTLNYDGYVIEI